MGLMAEGQNDTVNTLVQIQARAFVLSLDVVACLHGLSLSTCGFLAEYMHGVQLNLACQNWS